MEGKTIPRSLIMHPAYLSVRNVVRAFTDDPKQVDARTNLIVRQLFDHELLKNAASHAGIVTSAPTRTIWFRVGKDLLAAGFETEAAAKDHGELGNSLLGVFPLAIPA